jgi:hypothetical protein
MNERLKSYKPGYAVEDAPPIKTFELSLSATSRDLVQEVMRAFNLAKSAGQELNLTFHPDFTIH